MKKKINHNTLETENYGKQNMIIDENEKREIINFLEQDRGSYSDEKDSYINDDSEFDYTRNDEKPEYVNDSSEINTLKNELRIAKETSIMLEESLQSYEDKILDSIADNGSLHQQIDSLKTEIVELRIKSATAKRQRNEIRTTADELRGQLDLYRRALSSSEREITYLNAKLHVERVS
ncbi:MAG: hypothetical protein ACYTFY_05860 [Planctomycetota bacterium]|jgi:chromosome segregation ATPase